MFQVLLFKMRLWANFDGITIRSNGIAFKHLTKSLKGLQNNFYINIVIVSSQITVVVLKNILTVSYTLGLTMKALSSVMNG